MFKNFKKLGEYFEKKLIFPKRNKKVVATKFWLYNKHKNLNNWRK